MYEAFKNIYKIFLVLITGCAVALSLLFILSFNGFAIAGLFIVAPFVCGVLAVLWIIYLNLDRVYISLLSVNKSRGFLAYTIPLFFLAGILLLVQFAAVGGPHKGAGHFWISADDNPYLQMQLGLGLILLSGIMSIVVGHLNKR